MYQFVNCLRAIAAVLITNSHYGSIWPIEQLAVGGLLGNVIFFAVSGFCLFNVKENFVKWYLKRIVRVVPVMIAFTLFTVLLGQYQLCGLSDIIKLFVFPTNYVFLVWLLLLYPAFYVVAYFAGKHKSFLEIVFGLVFVSLIVVYLFVVDKSVYSIDNVSSPFILFIYFLSMLIGGFFKKNYAKFEKLKYISFIILILSMVVYFGTKVLFASIQKLACLQIVNQLTLLLALFYIFVVFIGLEDKLKKASKNKFWSIVAFLAKITLHVYLVQFVIIANFHHLAFPLNFVVVTTGILVLASALYYAEYYVRKLIIYLANRLKGNKYGQGKNL